MSAWGLTSWSGSLHAVGGFGTVCGVCVSVFGGGFFRRVIGGGWVGLLVFGVRFLLVD